MGGTWNAALKDLRRLRRDPLELLLWLGIPLLLGTMISLLLGGQGGIQPTAELLVADEDDSLLSGLLVAAFSQGPMGELVVVEQVERAAGRQRLDEGEATALLVIPTGFGDAVFEEEPTELLLVTNPAQRILPGIVEEALSILSDGSFYVHRVFGEELAVLQAQIESGEGPSDQDVALLSVKVNQALERVESHLFPPAIELVEIRPESEGPSVSFALLFLPGIVILAMVFTAQGLSEDTWLERQSGTLRRAAGAPAGLATLLAGKLLAGALVLTGVAAIVLTLGASWHGLPLSRLPLSVLTAGLAGTLFLALMTLVQLHATSQRAGLVLLSALVFPLLMVGGSFFPSEALPGWLATAGTYTPNGLAVESLKDLLLDRGDAASLAGAAAWAVVLIALSLALSLRRLRRVAPGS